MRELKFRYWNPFANKLVYNPIVFKEGWTLEQYFSDRGWTWEQYTGLKDKNGKEIYEGDIVRTKFVGAEPEIWVIGWDINLCRFGFFYSYKRILEGHWSDYDLKVIDYRKQPLEIIGNIHENPELLEHKG